MMTKAILMMLSVMMGVCNAEDSEQLLIKNTRQLTYDGIRAGEGYFSADGNSMIFQSEREENNPFYQIYLLNFLNGEIEKISTGLGKTTCAWLHPNGTQILFASTQDDPNAFKKQEEEWSQRRLGQTKKYAWDYDEYYDIYSYDLKSKKYTNLTNVLGYDAEGSYSPDGQKIVFASNRQAYSEKLDSERQKRLEYDKQFFMEIYIANADGSNPVRLTYEDGYDGGPFFSADQKKICWRRFNVKGDIAEIWTMNLDGSEAKALTSLKAMSWAPYFHPSGEYLIFTTNIHGFANFELYLVSFKNGKMVRVTTTDGFDGLPTFSSDGLKISWTSNRGNGGRSQIFIGEWNHEVARKLLSDQDLSERKDLEKKSVVQTAIDKEDIINHITQLSADEMQGRMTGTEGEKKAVEYVRDQLAAYGVLPYSFDGSWFDYFDFTSGVDLGKNNELKWVLQGKEEMGQLKKDWQPLSFSETGKISATEVVFAGYGIETPDQAVNDEGRKIEPYSSYAHLDVKDKWVLIFRYLPEKIELSRRNELLRYSNIRYKLLTARNQGAKGVILVSGPQSKVIDPLIALSTDASMAPAGIAAISVTDELVEKWLSAAGKNLARLQESLDTGALLSGFSLAPLQINVAVDLVQEKKRGCNVIGVLPAKDQPDPHVAPVYIGAHVDHLGVGMSNNSRATVVDAKAIHHGADDNASGVAGLLEVAQWIADLKKNKKIELKRDIVFCAWSGEELGLLGSNRYLEKLAKLITNDKIRSLTGMIQCYLNMDMIGRMNKNLILQGVGSSTWWKKQIEKRNVRIGLPLILQSDAHLPTDSTSFYLRGIPALSAFTGSHEDYHTPKDTVDKINGAATSQITQLMAELTLDAAQRVEPMDYVAMQAPKNLSRGSMRAFLGTIPDYAQGDLKGVKLSGVSPAGPAAKAGLKAGDIIIQLNSKKIENIYDYTFILGELKINEPVKIQLLRESSQLDLMITPVSRD
jgi:Tol biopolymer transport system component